MNQLLYGMKRKIIQIHPTLACNLFCDHCYSNSGPYATNFKLSPSILVDVIDDALEMGYEGYTRSIIHRSPAFRFIPSLIGLGIANPTEVPRNISEQQRRIKSSTIFRLKNTNKAGVLQSVVALCSFY
jgi:hypothetical protein